MRAGRIDTRYRVIETTDADLVGLRWAPEIKRELTRHTSEENALIEAGKWMALLGVDHRKIRVVNPYNHRIDASPSKIKTSLVALRTSAIEGDWKFIGTSKDGKLRYYAARARTIAHDPSANIWYQVKISTERR
jgi:hypothetical protein